jgi:UDP-N-acetylglucosamine 3-dehydrogenase
LTQTKNTPLKAAVIGIGSMGRNHARVYSEMNTVKLVALADMNESALLPLAERYRAKAYTDYREMLEKEKPDIVSIAVPTRAHYEVAAEAIKRGVNVLVEKPLAMTQDEGKKIIELAAKHKVKLGVGHIERFNPVVAALKKRLEEGLLGKVLQITIRRIGPFPERIKDVGVFLDLATHDIDLMLYLNKSGVTRASAESAQVLHSRHEDMAVGLLRFNDGMIGVIIENWLSPTKMRDAIINGERGMMVADFIAQDLYFYENNYTNSSWVSLQTFRGVAEGNMVRYHLEKNEPLRLELEAFARSVSTGDPFMVSGEDGLRTMELVEKLTESAAGAGQNT